MKDGAASRRTSTSPKKLWGRHHRQEKDREREASSNESPGETATPGPTRKLDSLIAGDTFRLKMNALRLVQRYEERPQDIKVSVIMPTWNRSFIVGRAIDSVLGQVYGNFELIVSDDGSTDDTEKLVRSNYEYDQRVKYIRSHHAGVSHARNVGLTHSTGELIAYLDSDNIWSRNYLLLMVNGFIDHAGVDTMYCGIRVIDNVDNEHYIRLTPYDRESLLAENYVDLNVFMHRRYLLEQLRTFSEELTALVDWDLILRYTKDHPPHVLECVLATYYLEKDYGHIRYKEDIIANYRKVRALHEKNKLI